MAARQLLAALFLALATGTGTVRAQTAAQVPTAPPPAWTPKTGAYNPRGADWAGVVSACRAVVRAERRIGNMVIRAAFHDSLAVDVKGCVRGNTGANHAACGGADSSLLLAVSEMLRPENSYDDFSGIVSRVVIKIASFYNVSAADTLAVCTAVAVDVLSNGRMKIIGRGRDVRGKLRVGRLDSAMPSPPNQLPAATATTQQLASFWSLHGFSSDEAMALMGTHALIDDQGCAVSGTAVCDPTAGNCTSTLRMFRLENHWFQDACTPSISIRPKTPAEMEQEQAQAELPLSSAALQQLAKTEACKFTSAVFKNNAVTEVTDAATTGGDKEDPVSPFSITWSNTGCEAGRAYGATSCPHMEKWPFTVNDAFLAQVCQSARPRTAADQSIQASMRKFLRQSTWDATLPAAILKMLDKYARFSPDAARLTPRISGWECFSGEYAVDDGCVRRNRLGRAPRCNKCREGECEPCCRCPTAFNDIGFALRPSGNTTASPTSPVAAPSRSPSRPGRPSPSPSSSPSRPGNSGNTPRPPTTPGSPTTPTPPGSNPLAVPPSPYPEARESCAGTGAEVDGFPSSPFVLRPFTRPFANPGIAQPAFSTCSLSQQAMCVDVYDIPVVETAIDLGIGCGRTQVLAYGGQVPGPTIQAAMGRQTLVRFTNQINPNSARYPPFEPCFGTRSGRPITIHLHGSASLAPYDGWAEDSICFGESKDYLYPNNRPATIWYHDHQLDITGENAHGGLASLYLVKNSTDVGVGPDRWGLDGMEEYHLMLADRVLDRQCQLRYEPEGVHEDDHYGDINLVSGIPFPRLAAQAKSVRLRLLSAAVSRPWLLSLVDAQTRTEVSSKICKVIAGDGGYRREPIDFPAAGLFMGVAERYEVVCNLAAPEARGKTLYLWNTFDDDRMKDVPFFCYSHLVMRIDVAATCSPRPGFPNDCRLALQPSVIPTFLDQVISQQEYDAAVVAARAGRCDRTFKFERGGGQWVINGETWVTARIAARDVGLNSHEIWCLETGGGWFHPVHIHLVDMYMLFRYDDGAFQIQTPYETLVPKDVVNLHPGAKVAMIARWGPHRGEYMFHCHNLRHEDNEMMRSFVVNSRPTIPNTAAPRFSPITELAFTTRINTTNKVLYDLYRDPLYPEARPRPTAQMPRLNAAYARDLLAKELYRIYYPGQVDQQLLCDPARNPWLVRPARTCG